ncbi:hypothetical protein E2A64_17245 [Pseudohoeflea suaedae]|uniref:Uncharacterized protein n=1 Tax=Pseudohoeflea suaedae TaxID=877384 RepID=A0A4R5PIP8_9HYPH|nr:hypothetical protein [Pseudohoeflea suaedae]TDH34411.1 hypothetical protein E2A64_17245 [Pseudohoeflea suaedae]
MTDSQVSNAELSKTHDAGDDAAYRKGVRQTSIFFAAIIGLAIASVAIFGFAGLITFYVAAAIVMLVTLVFITYDMG